MSSSSSSSSSGGAELASVADVAALRALVPAAEAAATTSVLFFWAPWSAPAAALRPTVALSAALRLPNLVFAEVDVDTAPELVRLCSVTSIPTCVFVQPHADAFRVVHSIVGAKPAEIVEKAEFFSRSAAAPAAPAAPAAVPVPGDDALTARLRALVVAHPIMLFMKGSPDAAQCGFSARAVELVRRELGGVRFGHFDILQDEAVRQGLKDFSHWPTFPQLYVQGKLIGGLDVMRELQEAGELKDVLAAGVAAARAVCTGAAPGGGAGAGANAGPQGAGDRGDAQAALHERLRTLITSSRVMLFMKGTPEVPVCGFSRRMVETLRAAGAEFGHFNILADESVRQGLKEYSKWPTYPQMYVDGKLIGGLDAVAELAEKGELERVLKGGGA